ISRFIEEEGGRVVARVNASIDYLITGYGSGNRKSAETKAVQEQTRKGAAIQSVTEGQFYTLLLPDSEEALQLLLPVRRGPARWRRLSPYFHNLPAPLDLNSTDLRGQSLAYCNLEHVTLDHADLREADLSWVRLPDLKDARLDGACLREGRVPSASSCSFK